MARKASSAPATDDLTATLELVAIADLRPHPRNDGTHPPEELDHLRQSIREHGIYRNIVIAEDSTLLAGHGVVAAAAQEGYTHVPAERKLYGPDDPRALKILVGDNHIARLRQQDDSRLLALLQDLQAADQTLVGTGWTADDLAATLATLADETAHTLYSRHVEVPLYEPHGPAPPVQTLADTTKTEALLGAIEAADLPEEDKAFLRLAARRHTVFNYHQIAEYYAHASAPMQQLMEASALVIIDFQQAIALGYVKLAAALAAQYQQDYGTTS